MAFDGVVTLGNILQIATMLTIAVGAYYAVSARMSVFEEMLRGHAATLKQHAAGIRKVIQTSAADPGR